MTLRKLSLLFFASLLLLWFTPWVFLLKIGTVRYLAYEPDSNTRFLRIVGPDSAEANEWTPKEDVSEECRAALIAAEDLRFYSHYGIDLNTMWSAIHRNWKKERIAWGGSTITQQIVKNIFLSREKTLLRKVREIVGALVLDRIMDKDTQLIWYLNIAEFGPHLYGIGAAARYYYRESPKELSLPQCVALFSLLPDPVQSNQSFRVGKIPQKLLDRQRAIVKVLMRTG